MEAESTLMQEREKLPSLQESRNKLQNYVDMRKG